MSDYLLKLRGDKDIGGRRPVPNRGDWDGLVVSLPTGGPKLPRPGRGIKTEKVSVGDRAWIWVNESNGSGGAGLSGRGTVTEIIDGVDGQRLRFAKVEIFSAKVGNARIPAGAGKETILGYIRSYNLHGAWSLDAGKVSELEAVLAKAGARPESCDESFWQSALERRRNLPAPERIRRDMVTRPAQQEFRRAVFALKGAACLLTGCSIEDTLEAAHVVPHNGDPVWDRPENGLPLRRDLHGLYDGLWWSIDPETSQVRLARRLLPSLPEYYRGIEGRWLKASAPRPLLIDHWVRFCASEDANRTAKSQPS